MQLLSRLAHNAKYILGAVLVTASMNIFADVTIPHPPEPPEGTKCSIPGDDDYKTAHHFEYLLHKRDQTMHQGIRTKQYSLKACINCHGPADKTVHYGDPKHFCSSCHNYASVNIDCFQCHADQPQPPEKISSDVKPASIPHYAETTAKESK